MADVLGSSGTITIGSAAQYVKDVNVEMSASEIDDTTRANQGWKSKRAGLREWSVSFDMIIHIGDAIYTTLLTAFSNGTVINGVIVADTAGHSITGAVFVTNFSKAEPLDDVVSVSVTLVGNGKPTLV